jgi:anti-sigma factor RsiW
MKTFEEKFTAWVDGRLTGAELAAFERELEAHPEALAEKEGALQLGDLLRTHVAAPPLKNADFFNHQLLQQIEADARESRQQSPAIARRLTFWTLPRMAFSGVSLLVLATLLYFAAVPKTNRQVAQNKKYVQDILTMGKVDPTITALSDDPNITATSFHSKESNADVVWLDGLNYMPPDKKLK